jgi:hypothetical protein
MLSGYHAQSDKSQVTSESKLQVCEVEVETCSRSQMLHCVG